MATCGRREARYAPAAERMWRQLRGGDLTRIMTLTPTRRAVIEERADTVTRKIKPPWYSSVRLLVDHWTMGEMGGCEAHDSVLTPGRCAKGAGTLPRSLFSGLHSAGFGIYCHSLTGLIVKTVNKSAFRHMGKPGSGRRAPGGG